MKKINKKEKIEDDVLFTMSEEIDSYVDRATKIINHMRQFGRKSDTTLRMIRIENISFYSTLRNKLMWGADKRN